MILVTDIRDHRERIENGLKKRNLQDLSVLDRILEADDSRKKTQFELDNILAESNRLAKEIGEFYKSGKSSEANALKAESSVLKERSRLLL